MRRKVAGIEVTNELILKLAALILTGSLVGYTNMDHNKPFDPEVFNVQVKAINDRLERIERMLDSHFTNSGGQRQ